MKSLQYFVGKICTVWTTPINRDYKTENPKTYPKPLVVYFMGVVECVDSKGIMLAQAATGLKTFLYHDHIVGLAEEEMVSENDPQYNQIVEEFKKGEQDARAKFEATPTAPTVGEFVDTDAMIENAKKLQDNFAN